MENQDRNQDDDQLERALEKPDEIIDEIVSEIDNIQTTLHSQVMGLGYAKSRFFLKTGVTGIIFLA